MLKARITLAASALALLSLTGCASNTQSVSASETIGRERSILLKTVCHGLRIRKVRVRD